MNRVLFLFLLMFVSVQSHGQLSDINIVNVSGLTVGLEKNYSIWVDYGFKNGIHINAKHSVIADKLSKQSWRLSASYSVNINIIQATATPFISSDWFTSFYNMGFSVKLVNLWKDNIVKIGAEYIPYYDKDLKFQHGWAVGAQTKLYKQISLFAEYGRKPDYRIAYERMYLGFDIKTRDLCVKPMIEIPSYDSGIRWTHSKIVVSMCYSFVM